MNLLINAFNLILYQPLFNALVFLYQILPGRDFGLAVILLTFFIRLALYPLMAQSVRSQKILADLQPKIQEVQQKYKDDKEKQARVMIELYQKEKINPFGGIFSLLIQLPILIALYQVFWRGLRPEEMNSLYSFVSNPGTIDPVFLGLINLSQASLFLALLAGVAQFVQSKMMMPGTSYQRNLGAGQNQKQGQMSQFSNMLQKQMLYFFPVLTVFILWKLPAAIGLYWIVTSLFSILQQYFVLKPKHAQ